jgi:hypothetical protein
MIIHCKHDIVFVQFFTMFPIHFFYNKACNWNIGFLQIVNISKLHHMLESNRGTFYFKCRFYTNFCVKNANPSFYAKRIKNGYFPLSSKFEMGPQWEANWVPLFNG